MATGPDVLILTSLTAGLAHTLLGPDHYLPFVVLSKARGWSYRKTFWITLACGLGHILGAVLLGYLTLHLGFSLEKLNLVESMRGNLAGWAVTIFGLFYLTWGLRLAFRKNVDITSPARTGLLPWALFIIFILGPCELLIPIVIYSAPHQNLSGVLAATSLFGAATISTMLAVVTVSYYGLNALAFRRWGRFSHALAGLVIMVCGIGIQFWRL
ncbi:MAG: hypothetical protein HZC18_04355 [Candidatus Omnitrophica bacterium]|nr:hypothetical protein [Candidatus Omnitrophota bacterium]